MAIHTTLGDLLGSSSIGHMHGNVLWIVCAKITVVLTVDTLRRHLKSGKQWSHRLLIFRLVALPALAVSAIIVAVNLTLSIMALRVGPFSIESL